MANLPSDESSTATPDLFFTTGSCAAHQKLLVLAVNISLSVTAFLGNALNIVALQKVWTLHSPSKILLGCLAGTDLCVCLITSPLFVAHTISEE